MLLKMPQRPAAHVAHGSATADTCTYWSILGISVYSPPMSRIQRAAFLIMLGLLPSWRAAACPLPLPVSEIRVEGFQLAVEIATTTEAIRCGLSHRKTLPAERGMLFIFAEPRPLTFWMKDTQLPLSIAFLDSNGRILSIQDMTPLQILVRYRSPVPASYALEVNQGWFARHGIAVGDLVQLPTE